jgi:hypothetical protein
MSKFASHTLFLLALLAATVAGPLKFARADDDQTSRFPQTVQRVFPWFPEDTETVVAAQSFTMPAPWGEDEVEGNSFPTGLTLLEFVRAWSALEGLVELERGKYLTSLAGKNVIVALRGGRNFEPISAFGHWRSEGCAIIVFEKELGEDATRWVAMLREGSKEVRRIAGRDVFVFPGTRSMDPARFPKPWLGVYLVLLEPNAILCATSDKYLEELLARVHTPSPKRALPDHLPEWKHVNPDAPTWMLRHVPERKEDGPFGVARTLVGVTFTITDENFQAVLVPKADTAKEIEQGARGRWIHEKLGVHPDVASRADGTLMLSSTTKDLSDSENFVFILGLDNLSGIGDYADRK